jgi:hypothetical protein
VGHGGQLLAAGLPVEGDVDRGAHGGQRGAQLVRGVGREHALTLQRHVPLVDAALDAVEHAVDRGRPTIAP